MNGNDEKFFREGDLVMNTEPIDKLNVLISAGMVFVVDSTVSVHHKGTKDQKVTITGEEPNKHIRVSGVCSKRFSLVMKAKDRILLE